jgi:uncharacterized protein YodC (DUF2158 family)
MKVGDVVIQKFRPAEPRMTVEGVLRVSLNGARIVTVNCAWFDAKKKLHRGSFPARELSRVDR